MTASRREGGSYQEFGDRKPTAADLVYTGPDLSDEALGYGPDPTCHCWDVTAMELWTTEPCGSPKCVNLEENQ